MKSQSLRSLLAAGLIAASAASSLPLFGNSALSLAQEPNHGDRPRRGKNGPPDTRPSQAASDKQQQPTSKENPADPQLERLPVDQPATDASSSNAAKSAQKRSSVESVDQQAAADGTQEQTAARRGRDAPPFDRPPISAASRPPEQPPDRRVPLDTQRDPSTARDSEVGRVPRKPPSSSRPAPSKSPDADQDAPSADPTDSGSDSSTRAGRKPPELRRAGDPRSQQQTDRDPPRETPATSRSGSSRPGTQVDNGDDIVRLDATLVNIPLLVSDRSGRYVPQLSKRDFTLQEDGVQQEIAFFGSEEVPFNVALLLDVSPSVAASLEEIQDAAVEFVRQLRSQDRVMVVSFDRHIDYLTDFTSNRRELESAIRRAATGSGTSVYDAVYETVVRRLKGIEGRKALILFSDGEDTTSSIAGYDEAVEAVTESDVLVYGLRYPSSSSGGSRTRSPFPSIQLPIPFPWPWPRRRRGPFADSHFAPGASTASRSSGGQWGKRNRNGDFMIDITAAGGGPVYDADQISDLSRLAARIAEELRHVYVVSYYPSNPLSNGGYRQIRIRVNGRPDIAVRHRRAYEARDLNQKGRT